MKPHPILTMIPSRKCYDNHNDDIIPQWLHEKNPLNCSVNSLLLNE